MSNLWRCATEGCGSIEGAEDLERVAGSVFAYGSGLPVFSSRMVLLNEVRGIVARSRSRTVNSIALCRILHGVSLACAPPYESECPKCVMRVRPEERLSSLAFPTTDTCKLCALRKTYSGDSLYRDMTLHVIDRYLDAAVAALEERGEPNPLKFVPQEHRLPKPRFETRVERAKRKRARKAARYATTLPLVGGA